MNLTDENQKTLVVRFLNRIELVGNKLPEPAILFLYLTLIVIALSYFLSRLSFTEIDPRNDMVLQINNLATGQAFIDFLSNMVTVFSSFPPLAIVLVAVLGIGVAESSGYVNTSIKILLKATPRFLLTPVLIFVGIWSHTAADVGYVLVIPLGGMIFYAVGRHPLAGIGAAFAGVSAGFTANFIPGALDPILQSFTQSAAHIIDPDVTVNILSNWYFGTTSSVVLVMLGWYVTEKIVEPKLANTPLDEKIEVNFNLDVISPREILAFVVATVTIILGIVILIVSAMPVDSAWRSVEGSLTNFDAPLMQAIVPLIFFFTLIPGLIYGFIAGQFKGSSDVVKSMNKSMNTMASYIVMIFFCAFFLYMFAQSNIGVLVALKGAHILSSLALPGQVTIVGFIALVIIVNLAMGSASAKWALLAPIVVPIFMQLGLSPELTQAAYRIGDSASNVITPLLPYFPLIVVFCQRYVSSMGIGTLIALMLPYSIIFAIGWTAWLLIYWGVGLPLGVDAVYVYPR